MEFLSLPASPIPRKISQIFIRALRAEPGIGGVRWHNSWEEAKSVWRETLARDDDSANVEKRVEKDIRQWHDWLDPPRFDHRIGMPKDAAIAICRRIEKWASKHLQIADDPIYSVAHEHASSVRSTIVASGLEQLTKIQLERIVDDAIEQSFCVSVDTAEAAPWSSIDKPGQIWGPCRSVIWWNFFDRSKAPKPNFWLNEEREALCQSGVNLEPVGGDQLSVFQGSLSALLNCTERLVLVRPRLTAGQPTSPHRLWHELGYWIRQSSPDLYAKLSVAAEKILDGTSPGLLQCPLGFEPTGTSTPPLPKRIWRIASGLRGMRTEESFTSIQALIGCPFAWALSYQGRIRKSAVLEVLDIERAAGNLAHLIIQSLFEESKQWTRDASVSRAFGLFDHFVQQIAAPMLLPGFSLELKRYKQKIGTAVGTLVELLNGAKLTVVGCELAREAEFESITFAGKMDLVCRTENNRLVLLDLKWTRWPKYRRKEIADGKHLQLACYSWLLSDGNNEFPEAGYFLLRSAQLLFTDGATFSSDTYVPGPSLRRVWEAAREAYKLHTTDIDNGTVIAAGVGHMSDEEQGRLQKQIYPVLQLEPPCKICEYGNLCGAKELK
jgi:hypothetical protein